MAPIRTRAEVQGIVQGVGFRPFVYQLARRFSLGGFVQNTSRGVNIEAEGGIEEIEAFLRALREEAPPLARVTRLETIQVPARG